MIRPPRIWISNASPALGEVVRVRTQLNHPMESGFRRDAAGAWRCASAHNTDVVAGMETHVRDEAGVLRPADGRATGDVTGDITGNPRPEAP